MKLFLSFCLAVISIVVVSAAEGDIFDNFDIKGILEDDEKRTKAFSCVLDKRPCGEYQIFRDVVSNMLNTQCGDCSASQKADFEAAFKHFQENHKEEYIAVMQKFMPHAL